MRFTFIEQHAATYPVRVMCRVLGVSASGYYGWRGRPPSARTMPVLSFAEGANITLLGDVRRIQTRHHGRYGSPRMHAALRAEGRGCSRGRVERLMRRHGIRALAGRRFRPCTTDSRHYLPPKSLWRPELARAALCRTRAEPDLAGGYHLYRHRRGLARLWHDAPHHAPPALSGGRP